MVPAQGQTQSSDARRERHDRLVERYLRGDPVAEIAKAEGVCVKTVRNVARRRGASSRRPDRTVRNKRILARYAKGESLEEIALSEGVHRTYVRAVGKRAGLPGRSRRKYPIDEYAFDRPAAAGWWLIGLIAADGCVHASMNRVSLAQRASDQDVLRAFYEYVGCPDRPLTVIKTKSAWSNGGDYREARIFSPQICASLRKHGIGPRKSQTLKFSEEAANQPAVWLGLLDGDGSAGLTRHYGNPRIDFFGTLAAMQQCSEFWGTRITLQTGRPPSLIAHRGGLYKVAIHGTNAAIAARIMLESSPTSMERKRRTLQQIAEYERAPHWTKRPKAFRYTA